MGIPFFAEVDDVDTAAARWRRIHLARPIRTEDVAACERFVRLTAGEADRLHSLLHSLGDAASVAADPWDSRNSPYEAERFTQTVRWISRHVTPGSLLVRDG